MFSYNARKCYFEEKNKRKTHFNIKTKTHNSNVFFLPSLLWSPCAVGLFVVDITTLVVSSLLEVVSVGRGATEKKNKRNKP